jgi:hypothetical protein
MGHLHALWHAALEQAEDGDLSQWSDELIAELSDYTGDAPQYVRLLQKHGWLDNKIIHDWLDYAGRYLEAKYRTAKPEKLKEIYLKHPKEARKTDYSQTLVAPPNLTIPTRKNRTEQNKPSVDFSLSSTTTEVDSGVVAKSQPPLSAQQPERHGRDDRAEFAGPGGVAKMAANEQLVKSLVNGIGKKL